MNPENSTCKNCRYARPAQDDENNVRCFRYPPTVMLIPVQNHMTRESQLSFQVVNPVVPGEHWCGEFAPWSKDTMQ